MLSNPLLWVAIGSALGGVLRHLLRGIIDHWTGSDFPWGILSINVAGSFVLGVLFVLLDHPKQPPQRELYLLLATGFCGGFTTFSTFSLDAYKLFRGGEYGFAVGYVAGSVLGGLLGMLAGIMATWGVKQWLG